MADNRDRQNVAALVLLLVLVVGGTLLFFSVARNVRVLDCVTAGFRNCGQPIDAGSR